MSHTAIAAALALDGVTGGERLVAFALASFANREQLAWPGTPAAAARAGLGRSRYLEAHARLLGRGLIETYEPGGGRGRSTTVLLRFAEGQRWDGQVNAELFETALCYSRSSGPGRLLVASIAALADEDRHLDGLSADELCAAAALAPSTYRRARNALIASGELELVRGLGGRGRTNHWRVADLRSVGQPGTSRPQRRTPPAPARPLMTPAAPRAADVEPAASRQATREAEPRHAAIEGVNTTVKGAQDRTDSAVKGAQDRTVSTRSRVETQPEREPQREPEREPPNARAWKEPGNHRTAEHPPNPPEGGLSADEVLVEESYITERGRERKRLVPVDIEAVRRELSNPTAPQQRVWLHARALMLNRAGASVFEVWLSAIELVAADREGLLVLAGPEATSSWVHNRFGRFISDCCEESGCRVRFASPHERLAIHRPPDACQQPTMNRRMS